MTHEDAGKYAAKHPAGTAVDPSVAAALEKRADNGRVTCRAAHEVAEQTGVKPLDIGKTIDLLEYRIVECQLGLFGYSPERKVVKAAEVVAEDLKDELQRHGTDGEITCASAWKIADARGMERMAVSAACETLGLKVKLCQLGAF